LDWNLKKTIGIPRERNEKTLEYATKIWKKIIFEIWNEKVWKFSFLKFEMKSLEIFILKFEMKKIRISLEGNGKDLKRRNHIFHLCHRDKTSNNTPIPPMYTTIYHMCKLGWYTINLSRQIFHNDPFLTMI
jgi:hypothetical protein